MLRYPDCRSARLAQLRSLAVRRLLCALALIVCVLTACGDDEPDAATTTQPSTTQATDGDQEFPCAPERTDCTSEEVVETMEQLYAIGGATEAEAACLAPITGEGKTAVNQATEAPTEAETQAAIECVGSEERLLEIAQGVAGYFESSSN